VVRVRAPMASVCTMDSSGCTLASVCSKDSSGINPSPDPNTEGNRRAQQPQRLPQCRGLEPRAQLSPTTVQCSCGLILSSRSLVCLAGLFSGPLAMLAQVLQCGDRLIRSACLPVWKKEREKESKRESARARERERARANVIRSTDCRC
jgi:hypothetical protein